MNGKKRQLKTRKLRPEGKTLQNSLGAVLNLSYWMGFIDAGNGEWENK